jgi:hypothetical protein
MAILRICSTDGCETKTLGKQCLEHELVRPVTRRQDREALLVPQLATAAD